MTKKKFRSLAKTASRECLFKLFEEKCNECGFGFGMHINAECPSLSTKRGDSAPEQRPKTPC